jgi:PAS domain S-box-containing protein
MDKDAPSKIGYRKIFLTAAFFVSILLVAIISIASDFALMPTFLTSSGPTLLRIVVLSLSASFYFASFLLLAWKYERSKSRTIFWYCLALSLICIALVASLLTMHIGSPMNWVSRIALYLSGIYFLIALFNPEVKQTNEDASGRWIEAFSTDREQIVSFFSKLSEGFVYGKAIEVSGKKDFVFLDANQAYEKIVSKKQADIIGKRYRQVFPNISYDPEFEEMLSLYYNVASTGESSRFERYSKYTDKWVDVLVYSQKKGYFIVLFQDITERKKAEEKLKQYQHNLEKLVDERTKQLKDAERLAAIGATAGMVGHDIRNPLQAITSDVYLVKTELDAIPESEEKKNALESLDEIEKNIDYINKIVQDLQDYARPLNPRGEQSSLEQIIGKLFITDVSAQNIKVSVKVEEDAKTIDADSYYITRIMYNLVTNAIQAMPKGGKLTVHAYREQNDAVITVTDTGVGIPKDIQNKMFTAMFTTKAKGQGFGLPVVKRMTESLGGTVTFESQEGKGTTFTIRLPQPPKKAEATS